MMHREVLSIQGGSYANYCGAHFWNIQDISFLQPGWTAKDEGAAVPDVLYREGLSAHGKVTFTPRLLLFDTKASLGCLPRSGGLPQPEAGPSTSTCDWPNVDTVFEPVPEKNAYLKYIDGEAEDDAEEDINVDPDQVNTWTDYLFSRFHPRTINLVNVTSVENETIPLQTFHSGEAAWKSDDLSETFCDNMRRYVEECNNLQGFQISFDCTDGYGGLISSCMEYVADEYSNKSVVAFPLLPSHFDGSHGSQDGRDLTNLRDSVRLINDIFSFERCFQFCDLFSPLCTGERGWRKPGAKRNFPYVDYDPEIYYHSSAILASAIDTVSLKYRRNDVQFAMSDLCADMTGYSRKMAATGLGLPFRMRENENLIERLDRDESIFTCVTPNCTIGEDKIFQHVTVRGIPHKKLKKSQKSAGEQMKMPAYRCETRREMFELYFQSKNYASATNVSICDRPLKVRSPFPDIFSEHLNGNGFVKEFVSTDKVDEIPLIAGLHNGSFIFDTLESLCREAKRVKVNRLHPFKEHGLEEDDVIECIGKLQEIQSNYEDAFEL